MCVCYDVCKIKILINTSFLYTIKLKCVFRVLKYNINTSIILFVVIIIMISLVQLDMCLYL